MRQLMSSVILGSSTLAWCSYVTLSCTGWTLLYVSSVSLERLPTGVFKAGRPGIWWTAAHLPYCTSCVASSQRLRCASRYQLILSRHRCIKFGRRAFSVVGPMTWNSQPDDLHDPMLSDEKFSAAIHTFLQVSEHGCSTTVLYKCTATYLLNY